MNLERIKNLLTNTEGIRLEFKEAKYELPRNLFESICAMLNREGGDILLGVADDGVIVGVEEGVVASMMKNLTNLSNNSQKINPPFILFPQKYAINDKWIIHIQVPSSSQVHNVGGIIYDRSNDGDFKVTQPHQIAELHNRKRNYYTESIIYPMLHFEDFKVELFPKIRNLLRSNNPDHPWLEQDDKQMLQMSGLWKRDFQTGQEGYTLAAALLLGKDEVIQQIVPHYKIDAMVRIQDAERYDDREYIQTNLIEAYDRLMDFVAKHLPDKFHMQGAQRTSLRTTIFREVVANLIVHREYTNAYPCKFTIFADRVETENANNPRGYGKIDPTNFAPFPKNPTIAKFFIQLGRVEELGSGVLNVSKLVKEYTNGGEASFIDGDIFRMIVPIIPKVDSVNPKVDNVNHGNDSVNPKVDSVNRGNDSVNPKVDNVNHENDNVNTITEKINEAVNNELITKPNKTTINGISDILYIINGHKGGIAPKDIISQMGKSSATIYRYLKILKQLNLVEYRGSAKTGKYFAV